MNGPRPRAVNLCRAAGHPFGRDVLLIIPLREVVACVVLKDAFNMIELDQLGVDSLDTLR
jgi:hypothetical protein